MNKLKLLLLSISSIAILFSGCDKEEDHHHNHEAVITIDSPFAGQQFEAGDTVLISGKITSEEQLHGYEIIIRQKSDNSEKFSKDAHTHGKELTYSEIWVTNVHGHQDMELIVKAHIDHDGTSMEKTVDFHCHGH